MNDCNHLYLRKLGDLKFRGLFTSLVLHDVLKIKHFRILQILITATPSGRLAILSACFRQWYARSISAKSFLVCEILAWISTLVEGSVTMIVKLLLMVTFLAMPS